MLEETLVIKNLWIYDGEHTTKISYLSQWFKLNII